MPKQILNKLVLCYLYFDDKLNTHFLHEVTSEYSQALTVSTCARYTERTGGRYFIGGI